MQPARIAQRRLEKIELLPARGRRLQGHGHGHDRVLRAKIFQMSLKEAEEDLHRVSRIGNLETVLILGFVRESELESELAGDEIKRAEAAAQLFKEAPQDKKERLGGFDFVLEFDLFLENFRWPIAFEGGELAEGVHAPLVENGEDAGNFSGALVFHARKIARRELCSTEHNPSFVVAAVSAANSGERNPTLKRATRPPLHFFHQPLGRSSRVLVSLGKAELPIQAEALRGSVLSQARAADSVWLSRRL